MEYEGLIQYLKDGGPEHESRAFKSKTVPAVGDYVQWDDTNAFLVKRVYHIPYQINEIDNPAKVDFILFGEFVSDLGVSDF